MRPSDRFVLAIDSGTTSVRAILFDETGRQVAVASSPLTQHFPRPGWVEHDPMEIFARQVSTMAEVQYASGVRSDQIAAVGITNQRETAIVWDRASGKPVCNAICWQCRRTAPQIEELKLRGLAPLVASKTGLVPDAYFSATKVAWILDEVPGARERAEAGELLSGTVDTWLVWNLTGGAVHATDPTNASRTMLYNIRELDWDGELLELFGVPRAMLPEVRPSSGSFGRVVGDIVSSCPPICGVAGDQQASLFGHGCFEAGEVKATYGTGCFILMNTGSDPVASSNGLVTTVAASADGRPCYALEGSVFNAGTVVQWLRDELRLIDDVAETEEIARSVPDSAGVYMVPAFTGLGAPWWDSDARGIICGLTRGTKRAHLVRAALESEAYQVLDVVEAMRADAGFAPTHLAVDGGGSRNDFTMQRQADLLGCTVTRPVVTETTALGAAYLAGLAAGFWGSLDEVRGLNAQDARFDPAMDEGSRAALVAGWREALGRCRR